MTKINSVYIYGTKLKIILKNVTSYKQQLVKK